MSELDVGVLLADLPEPERAAIEREARRDADADAFARLRQSLSQMPFESAVLVLVAASAARHLRSGGVLLWRRVIADLIGSTADPDTLEDALALLARDPATLARLHREENGDG